MLKSNYNYNPILNNRIILYFISFLALIDILYFLNVGDIKSFLVFIFTGLLTTFYNKNMIVVLVLALCITHIYKYGSSAYSNEYTDYEGLENMNTEYEEDEDENDEYTDYEGLENMNTEYEEDEDDDENNEDTYYEGLENMNTEYEEEDEKEELKKLKSGYEEFQEIQKGIVESLSNIEPKLVKAENFIKTYEQYKSKIENDVE
jgi:hypothetical protein